ncbi:3-deoxy-7-phosphoheptulonate synthase [Deinococcus maricopensis]|uniref:Phospho-2-dehydro-3-deoxyheptonate aldolase n=1 Tax=Deinococcus maricopensis (strain DSM 21211 / LMG 22137 / NRRL B-23946 / LB-34) TaxID=709986 RepID=E8U723_DEIML|nr:3-deoxy-7-phosphoheptulonate synthase [Deinococcus maricopensis]ADV66862.1 phospho-2-dehydro-3-deoxyheptonate aldolase [Deinococcus maricopensis DSM 21211]
MTTPGTPTENLHVTTFEPVITPRELKTALPLTARAERTVLAARDAIRAILHGHDDRLLLILGPCSIHDEHAALDYAHRLAHLRERTRDRLELVMRVYVEKPRTTVGWRGFLTDPHMNGAYDLSTGLHRTRALMGRINELGLPVATELLDPFVPQYLFDLLAWGCLGARTVESQTHRVMASAVSAPMGFKNGTGGSVKLAVDAITAAKHPHAFFTITEDARACIVHTSGNPDGHVILRGGTPGPNFDAHSVADTEALLRAAGHHPAILVDCSHANSRSDHTRQAHVWRDVLQQRARGTTSLKGLMLESHLHPGKQPLTPAGQPLQYGVSVTDACLGWTDTEALVWDAYETLQ